MIDKEKKNKIADILLDFYDEYYSNVINRPMIPNIYAGKILDSLQEEPVSEDLEEAADEYAPDFSNSIASKAAVNAVRDAFKAGAKWQKEQMIAKAIDGEVLENYDGKVLEYDDSILDKKLSDYKVFDKVKVIVIKED